VFFLLLLATVFVGMGATVLAATLGEPTEPDLHVRDRLLLVAPPMAMLLVVLMLGLYLPAPLIRLLQEAAALLEMKP
jgi:hydrogenase-4 component F